MEPLYTREFTEAQLALAATCVGFTRQMLDAAEYPQAMLDDMALLTLQLQGAEFDFSAARRAAA